MELGKKNSKEVMLVDSRNQSVNNNLLTINNASFLFVMFLI